LADVTYIQTLKIVAGKTPTSGNQLLEKFFEINPSEILEITDYNEQTSQQFAIPDGAVDAPICTGTVDAIKIMVIRPQDADLEVKLISGAGTSQNLTFVANKTSILHCRLTGILASNSSGTPIKGSLYLCGD
jgi:hypothetical protein